MHHLRNLTVLILGLGDSGLAMARWCARCGAAVRVADTRANPPQAATLAADVPAATLHHGLDVGLLDGVNLVLKSPGLMPNAPDVSALLAKADELGIPRSACHRLLAEGAIGQALVVDLDVHQGDGTARIFEGDPSVFTLSMHAEKNFPHRKATSDLDVELADGTGDVAYLEKLGEILPALLSSVRPDIVFFNAGVDPHADDKLGRLSLTDDGLGRREAYVLGACLSLEIPVVGVIGGGYDADIDRLAARHAILHRTAKSLYSSVA